MLSHIRIGCFAIFAHFLFAQNATFAQTRPAPLPPLDSLGLKGMQQAVEGLVNDVFAIQRFLETEEPLAGERQLQASTEWTSAKMDTTLPKSRIDSLEKISKKATAAYQKRFDQVVKSGKLKRAFDEAPLQDSLGLRKKLPKLWKQTTQLFDEVFPPEPVDKQVVATEKAMPDSTQKTETRKPKIENVSPAKRFAAYNPAADVMMRPPTPPCTIASSSRDEFSGEISREMQRAELFRYTNPALKTYLQGKTHVICEAAVASSGPNAALLLTFNINDPNARKAFGRLEKNSMAVLKFMDGSTFTLQNAGADDGVFNPETGATIYRARYPLNPEVWKKISRLDLDQIRIAWSNGYDDYEVQQVNLLSQQAQCLTK